MGYIKLDKNALINNIDIIAKTTRGVERVAAVLKDNAYGHGLEEIAKIASEFGIKRAVVRNRSEAKRIEGLFEYILILSDTLAKDSFVYTINDLEALKNAPFGAKIEIKVDTGMHRNGILPQELKDAFAIAFKKELNIQGVFTHFRSADELSSELFWQNEAWKRVKEEAKKLAKKYHYKLHFHSCNSAALFRRGIEDDDFARVGIALYGYVEFDEVFELPSLKPVLSLWARRVSKRVLKKGERVGYGGVGVIEEDGVVSNYDVGYADGIFRSLSRFKDAPLIGRISMDNSSVLFDSEEICVFDDAKGVARELGTISYEVLVKLSSYLERVVVNE